MAMRWLTREWQSGALPGGERESRWQTYLEHRDATAIHLPPALHRLAAVNVDGALTLHQAVPDWWAFETGKALTLSVITGDDGHAPELGPQRVVLQYIGNLELVDATAADLDTWLARPDARLLYDEIEVLPGRRFEQRFLLAPDGEVTVRFDNVVLLSAPTAADVREALVESRQRTDTPQVDAPAPTPVATPAPVPVAESAPAAPPAPAAESASPVPQDPTDVVPDPPEGAPAAVPDSTAGTDVAESPEGGKRTLRETLLGWLPGVRGRH